MVTYRNKNANYTPAIKKNQVTVSRSAQTLATRRFVDPANVRAASATASVDDIRIVMPDRK